MLVYGEDKRYVKEYELEEVTVTKKGKKIVEKVKNYTGKYIKEKETDSSWQWVSLEKIQSCTARWGDRYKDDFGYSRAKPSWGEGLTDEEKEARRKALNNEYDEKAFARRKEGATTIEEHKKTVEKKMKEEKMVITVKKEPGVKAQAKTLSKKTLKGLIDKVDEEKVMELQQELRDEKNYTKDLKEQNKDLLAHSICSSLNARNEEEISATVACAISSCFRTSRISGGRPAAAAGAGARNGRFYM